MSNINTEKVKATLAARYKRERRFRRMGLFSILASIAFLAFLMANIFANALPAFSKTMIQLDIHFDRELLALPENPDQKSLRQAEYSVLVKAALRNKFPDVKKRRAKKALYSLVSGNAGYRLRDHLMSHPEQLGTTQTLWLTADDDIDTYFKGNIDRNLPEGDRRIKDNQLVWLDQLTEEGRMESRFNDVLFQAGDSREPEQAGILGALKGSFYTLVVTLLLSFPIGVAAATYLEEFAPRNRWTDLIEVNINNLAAVPSIVFGLLGLAVFINFFHLPRSAPLVGGIVLSLMTLPTIIIASRAALRAVPPSIRDAALGIGASKIQMVFHHVLPLAMPGILTGTIIGLAQALGETAPLLMIGMVAFIVDVPGGFTDPSTVLPVQIFLWSDSPERAFTEKTSAAIVVLLGFLILMNALAVYLRKHFERRW